MSKTKFSEAAAFYRVLTAWQNQHVLGQLFPFGFFPAGFPYNKPWNPLVPLNHPSPVWQPGLPGAASGAVIIRCNPLLSTGLTFWDQAFWDPVQPLYDNPPKCWVCSLFMGDHLQKLTAVIARSDFALCAFEIHIVATFYPSLLFFFLVFFKLKNACFH